MDLIYGAGPEAWAHFDLILGLGEELLPVVSNPTATISPLSKMKGLGKTPSRYNGRREVAGIADWTSTRATDKQIEAWSAEPDYGICLQTRRVRALDIDVDDADLSADIAAAFMALVDAVLPARVRYNSGKQLRAFIVEGDLSKRSFKVNGGLVEFLATGQQFIAAGQHPSGAPYQWAGGLPMDFPAINAEVFEAAWAKLVEQFAIEPERVSTRGVGKGDGSAVDDEVATWLEEKWETYGVDKGKLFVACPWKDGHSSDSGETEAAWLLAGTGGFARGHFECLHASCAARTDDDFLRETGYAASDFEDLTLVAAAEGSGGVVVIDDTSPLGMSHDAKGMIEVTVNNVSRALDAVGWLGYDIRFDEFKGQVVWRAPTQAGVGVGGVGWRPWTDADYTRLRLRLEHRGFKPVGRELARDVVNARADSFRIDTAIEWLDTLRWDGVPRIDAFWSRYFGVEDTPYSRAVAAYTWTALAGRVLEPGLQADMVPVLAGAQGAGKSRGIAAMSPGADTHTVMSFHEPETERARKMRGVLTVELAELQGLRSRDAEEIKAWVTKSKEHWTPKYQEMTTSYLRRCLMFGTTNGDDFLGDTTGERRWLPMAVGAVDIESIKHDRDQLWAEAAARFVAGGLAWRGAVELAPAEHDAFKSTDVWDEVIWRWLNEEELDGSTPAGREYLSASEVLSGALGLEAKSAKKADEMRVARCLHNFAYSKVQRWIDGKPRKVWALEVDKADRS